MVVALWLHGRKELESERSVGGDHAKFQRRRGQCRRARGQECRLVCRQRTTGIASKSCWGSCRLSGWQAAGIAGQVVQDTDRKVWEGEKTDIYGINSPCVESFPSVLNQVVTMLCSGYSESSVDVEYHEDRSARKSAQVRIL